MRKIGVADTMFAKADMGGLAFRALRHSEHSVAVERTTVPGIKDLPVAAKKLIDEGECDLVMALGMVGAQPIDRQCAHEAATGLINAQLQTNKHILTVFVHEDEAKNVKELASIMKDRTLKHCSNALDLLFNHKALEGRAGTAQRQGKGNEAYFEL